MSGRSLIRPDHPFMAGSPGLPVQEPPHRSRATVAEYVATAEVVGEDGQGLALRGTTQTGKEVAIALRAVAPGILRVLLEAVDADPHRARLAREGGEKTAVSIDRSPTEVTLTAEGIVVRIQLDPFHLSFRRPDGTVFLHQTYTESYVTNEVMVLPFGFSTAGAVRLAFHDTFTAAPDEHFYGFGEKFTDFDKRGQWLEMWNYDAYGVDTERAYKNVPFFVSSRGYGLFVDSVTPVSFDMAATCNAAFSAIVPDSALDYYVIAGPDPRTIITRYAGIVGFPILPPRWAFGLWMSSGFMHDRTDAVLDRARGLRDHGIPCDVLHLDCYWQRSGRWSEMLWDREAFPDPEALVASIKADNFKLSLWINPYLSRESQRFVEAAERGYLLRTPEGAPYVIDLWGPFQPAVGIVDMTNPDAVSWFQDLLRPLLRMGADVFKTDFGEGVPADAVAHNGMTGAQLHNLYSLLYNDAVAAVTTEETGRAGLVWGRSTYAGGQRHAAQWGGDPNCSYEALASTLRGGLSLAMCGHPFWSHDIGGFRGQPTPDLYVRWAQLGLFSPLSRAHGMTSRLPWDFGEEALRIVRDYVRLRYRLLPYIYSQACLAARTSLPLLRPMVLEYPDDPCTYTMDLQYMLGPDLLVAPVYNSQGRRPVYFPRGRWVDFWSREVVAGPATRFVDVPLEVLPLYVRGNALIPTIEPPDHIDDNPFAFVTFEAYLSDRGECELRDGDGMTTLWAAIEGTQLTIRLRGAKEAVGVHLLPLAGSGRVETVQVNGSALGRLDSLLLAADGPAGWTRDGDGAIRAMVRR